MVEHDHGRRGSDGNDASLVLRLPSTCPTESTILTPSPPLNLDPTSALCDPPRMPNLRFILFAVLPIATACASDPAASGKTDTSEDATEPSPDEVDASEAATDDVAELADAAESPSPALYQASVCPSVGDLTPADWPAFGVSELDVAHTNRRHGAPQFWVIGSSDEFVEVLQGAGRLHETMEQFADTDFAASDLWILVVPAFCQPGVSPYGSSIANVYSPEGEVLTIAEFFLPELIYLEPGSRCDEAVFIGGVVTAPKGAEPKLCVMGHGDQGIPRGRLKVFRQGTTELMPQIP